MKPEPSGALVDRLATYFERGRLDPAQARRAAIELSEDPKALAELGRDLVDLAQRADAPYPVDVPVRQGPEAAPERAATSPVSDNVCPQCLRPIGDCDRDSGSRLSRAAGRVLQRLVATRVLSS